jgi:hypothetical protein
MTKGPRAAVEDVIGAGNAPLYSNRKAAQKLCDRCGPAAASWTRDEPGTQRSRGYARFSSITRRT